MAKNTGLKYQTLYKKITKMRDKGILSQGKKRKTIKPANIRGKIAELDGNMELDRKYNIKKLGTKDKFVTTDFEGKLIQVTDKFYTFKNKNRAESFLKVDFVTGGYEIKEVAN
mgnify:CR=1 FL=1